MKIVLTLAALAAGTLVAPAYARDAAPQTAQRTVAHADLDLRQPGDVRRLDRRIDIAAEAACGTASEFDLAGRNAVSRCRKDTVAALSPRRAAMIATARGNGGVALAAAQSQQ